MRQQRTAPSTASSIFPIEPKAGDRCGVWFGRMDDEDYAELQALRVFAKVKGWKLYLHRKGEITSCLIGAR